MTERKTKSDAVQKTPKKMPARKTAIKAGGTDRLKAIAEKKPAAQKKVESKRASYVEAVGRRKTSVARVRLYEGEKGIVINGKDHLLYFPTLEMRKIAEDALHQANAFGKCGVSAAISGGGIHSQAEALRHGIARALAKHDSNLRSGLKKAGYIMRDPRMKERRKFGLKKARKAPQWSKR